MMKLPNGDQAQLGDKLDRYILNPQHPKGKDKATLFKNRLGITLENKEILENILLDVAVNHEAIISMVRTIFDKKAIHRIGCGYKQKALDR